MWVKIVIVMDDYPKIKIAPEFSYKIIVWIFVEHKMEIKLVKLLTNAME